VQKVVVDLLNAIYEQDFLGCSYGFRPGRGQHQALDEVGRVICTRPMGWVLEIDIRSYFDKMGYLLHSGSPYMLGLLAAAPA
jgi:retron-type reverse transcriptase